MNDELFKIFEEEFKKQLEQKTNWGRNQIMTTFYLALSEATLKWAKNTKESDSE